MLVAFTGCGLDDLGKAPAEVLACAVFKDDRPLLGLASLVDWRLAGSLSRLARGGFLAGELGEVVCLPGRPRVPYDKVLVFGLGARAAFGDDVLAHAWRHMGEVLAGLRVRRAVVEPPGRAGEAISAERAFEPAGQVAWPDDLELVLAETPEARALLEKRLEERRGRSRRAAGLAST